MSESFNDKGMPPVPFRWKGTCEEGYGFSKDDYNKKLIGARMFHNGLDATVGENDDYKSPIDQMGHGTHTASTAAGSLVQNASLLGYASGRARGMAAGARIAAYKVCWLHGCFGSDIIAAIDAAVADGVDVLSISLGKLSTLYSGDFVTVASFHAMEKGISVSCAAGNEGPHPSVIADVAPRITTVGASTLDRNFLAVVKLGNERKFAGFSLCTGKKNVSGNKQYPLVYMGSNNLNSPTESSLCLAGALNPHDVAGKIVICLHKRSAIVLLILEKERVVKEAGGVGMILVNPPVGEIETLLVLYDFPAVSIGSKEGKEIIDYALASPNATATLAFLGTKLGVKPVPIITKYSSRGPNSLALEIMKPDVIARGVNILASWPYNVPPTRSLYDKRQVKFNILSGISMSCPHVSGIAALLKAKHPDWSPAAIKSALMTAAYIHDNTKQVLKDESTSTPANAYVYGAGHIYPRRANDSGLVYDIEPQDYFEFLCTQNLTSKQLGVFSNTTCYQSLASPSDLNYPAISVIFPDDVSVSSVTVHRTVTNVGPACSKHHVRVTPFESVFVIVRPKILKFTRRHHRRSYKIKFKIKKRQIGPEFGDLIWKGGKHVVRSPIILNWLEPK